MDALPIPKPQVLEAGRPLRHRGTQFTEDDRPRAELLDVALHESCANAEQLWDELNAMRQYLLDSVPPGPTHRHRPGRDRSRARVGVG